MSGAVILKITIKVDYVDFIVGSKTVIVIDIRLIVQPWFVLASLLNHH